MLNDWKVSILDDNLSITDIVQSVMKQKLKHYIAGKISSEIARQHHKKTKLKEDAGGPTNAMGHSSSTSGTGPIDTYDPLLLKKLVRRKQLQKDGPASG